MSAIVEGGDVAGQKAKYLLLYWLNSISTNPATYGDSLFFLVAYNPGIMTWSIVHDSQLIYNYRGRVFKES